MCCIIYNSFSRHSKYLFLRLFPSLFLSLSFEYIHIYILLYILYMNMLEINNHRGNRRRAEFFFLLQNQRRPTWIIYDLAAKAYIVAVRVQYNSFPKILSAPDIYTTDAFVTAVGALENTSRVISVAITAIAPCSDRVGGGSTYNSSVFLRIYIYRVSRSVFLAMMTTRPALNIIYIYI
jgi:hypothetical protein